MKKGYTSPILKIWGFPADLILMFVVIAAKIATLYPFNFSLPANFSLDTIFNRFDNTSFFKDQINNILLFMPLGFAITSFLLRKNVSAFVLTIMVKRKALNVILLVIGIVLPSLIIESILIHTSDKSFSLVNLVLGIFFTACTTLIFKARTMILSN